jgi:hypothetical protein
MRYGWMYGDHVAGDLFPIFESFVALTANRRGEVDNLIYPESYMLSLIASLTNHGCDVITEKIALPRRRILHG